MSLEAESAILIWLGVSCEQVHGEFVGYSFQLYKNSSVLIQTAIVNQTDLSLSNLQPYTKYKFTVRTVNHVAMSSESFPIEWTTKQSSKCVSVIVSFVIVIYSILSGK